MKKLFIPPVLVFISLIVIITFCFVIPKYNTIPFPYNFAGLLIAFSGFVIMGKSRDLFKKHNTTLAIEKPSSLIREGIFAKTRNPMYLGMFLLLLGLGVCFMNIFSILTSIGFIVAIRLAFIPKEERLLTEAFGQEYLHYKKKVRRWI